MLVIIRIAWEIIFREEGGPSTSSTEELVEETGDLSLRFFFVKHTVVRRGNRSDSGIIE